LATVTDETAESKEDKMSVLYNEVNWNVRNKNLAGLKKFAENKGLLVIVLAADTHVSGDDLDDHDVDWSSKTSNVEFSVVSVTDANGVTISGKQFHKLIEEIKNEIRKGNPVIVILDYSLEQTSNHFYVIDGFNEEKMRLMCPNRGFVYWSYDYLKQLNYNYWMDSGASGYEPHLYEATLVQPKD